jgi:hypothetical protein
MLSFSYTPHSVQIATRFTKRAYIKHELIIPLFQWKIKNSAQGMLGQNEERFLMLCCAKGVWPLLCVKSLKGPDPFIDLTRKSDRITTYRLFWSQVSYKPLPSQLEH